MNTHALELIAKLRHLCLLLLLCLHLVLGGIPGPCRHSVTQDHIRSINRLIDNQLDQGCLIIYPFTDHFHLSEICYVKAALPQVLELLNTYFHYARSSDNRRYVSTLERVIFHLYSHGCIPGINEEIEESPQRFIRMVKSSPKEALKRVKSVIEMYLSLITTHSGPLDWACQAEYASDEDYESTTVVTISTTEELSTVQVPC